MRSKYGLFDRVQTCSDSRLDEVRVHCLCGCLFATHGLACQSVNLPPPVRQVGNPAANLVHYGTAKSTSTSSSRAAATWYPPTVVAREEPGLRLWGASVALRGDCLANSTSKQRLWVRAALLRPQSPSGELESVTSQNVLVGGADINWLRALRRETS